MYKYCGFGSELFKINRNPGAGLELAKLNFLFKVQWSSYDSSE
jgi:hypothetical protein